PCQINSIHNTGKPNIRENHSDLATANQQDPSAASALSHSITSTCWSSSSAAARLRTSASSSTTNAARRGCWAGPIFAPPAPDERRQMVRKRAIPAWSACKAPREVTTKVRGYNVAGVSRRNRMNFAYLDWELRPNLSL